MRLVGLRFWVPALETLFGFLSSLGMGLGRGIGLSSQLSFLQSVLFLCVYVCVSHVSVCMCVYSLMWVVGTNLCKCGFHVCLCVSPSLCIMLFPCV